ncbi:IgGFc-binding protein [Fluviicola sp.]|jgi:hypothetical protein|uniref:IgGFc-binding protein n=1 Tax=Fluviicola sp. TaxID=1917219 RepID=UPI00281C7E63|nr:IgGFc-binding protein [Fluviicola sp.]MDR0801215.1 IgGFc-binding protein [Fluviicola sp.]
MKNIIICLACLILPQKNRAQVVGTPYIPYTAATPTIQVTDFWVTFPGINASTFSMFGQLNIVTGDAAANVIVAFPGSVGVPTFAYPVAANSLQSVDLSALGPYYAPVYGNSAFVGGVQSVVHVTSDKPVSVYAFASSNNAAGADATALLPVAAWGKGYCRLSYAPYSGNNNPTTGPYTNDYEMFTYDKLTPDYPSLTVTPTAPSNFSLAPFIIAPTIVTIPVPPTPIIFETGHTAIVSEPIDRTGRFISTDYPCAYFTANSDVQIPVSTTSGGVLFEQNVPINQWGKKFLVPNIPEPAAAENNRLRVVAATAGTTLSVTGATFITSNAAFSGTLANAGDWAEYSVNAGGAYIESNQPVGVAAYLVSTGSSSNTGAPSMAYIPPIEQSIPKATVAPFILPNTVANTNFGNAAATHTMVIITKTATKGATTIDDGTTTTTLSSGWTDNSGYSYYLWNFNNTADFGKAFKVVNSAGIIVLCSGQAPGQSYYYNAASGTSIINP